MVWGLLSHLETFMPKMSAIWRHFYYWLWKLRRAISAKVQFIFSCFTILKSWDHQDFKNIGHFARQFFFLNIFSRGLCKSIESSILNFCCCCSNLLLKNWKKIEIETSKEVFTVSLLLVILQQFCFFSANAAVVMHFLYFDCVHTLRQRCTSYVFLNRLKL